MKTTITKKGQIVIPAKLRRKYDITAGTTIRVDDEEGKIVLTPVTSDYVGELRGITKGSGALKVLEQERKNEREHEADRL